MFNLVKAVLEIYGVMGWWTKSFKIRLNGETFLRIPPSIVFHLVENRKIRKREPILTEIRTLSASDTTGIMHVQYIDFIMKKRREKIEDLPLKSYLDVAGNIPINMGKTHLTTAYWGCKEYEKKARPPKGVLHLTSKLAELLKISEEGDKYTESSFDRYIGLAKEEVTKRRYDTALKYYMVAKRINPTANLSGQMAVCTSQISEYIKRRKEAYTKYKEGNYNTAYTYYQSAEDIMPHRKTPPWVAECQKKLTRHNREKNVAENHFSRGQYFLALQHYETAQKIIPLTSLSSDIAKCKAKLRQTERQRTERAVA